MIAQLDKKQVAELKRMLVQVPKRIRNKILRQELRKGAKELVQPSKAATPIRMGTLRKSVKVRSARSRKAVAMRVGYSDKAFSGDTFYGSFLEWGWKTGKRKSGKQVLGRRVRRLTEAQRAQVDAANDSRTKIPGRFILLRVAERYGPPLLDRALDSIYKKIVTEARNA